MIIDRFPDRTIQIEGQEFQYFGGTSYLGLATNDEFQKLLATAIEKWGTSYGSSRNSNIKLSVFDDFENKFSQFVNSEASMAVSSGMLAGMNTMNFLSENHESFYHFPNTHPAILAKESIPIFFNGKIHPNLINEHPEEIIISVDAVLSAKVKPTNFDFLDLIPSSKKITLVIDESHSLGLIGDSGCGVFNSILHKNIKRKIMVSSFGKAMGLSFGIIASDKYFIDQLKNEAVFIAASATNPAFLETFIKADSLYQTQRDQMQSNLNYFFHRLNLNASFDFHAKYPVIYSNDDTLYSTLLNDKMVISKFKYPTYDGFLNRIVITSNHTHHDLDKLKNILNMNYGK